MIQEMKRMNALGLAPTATKKLPLSEETRESVKKNLLIPDRHQKNRCTVFGVIGGFSLRYYTLKTLLL